VVAPMSLVAMPGRRWELMQAIARVCDEGCRPNIVSPSPSRTGSWDGFTRAVRSLATMGELQEPREWVGRSIEEGSDVDGLNVLDDCVTRLLSTPSGASAKHQDGEELCSAAWATLTTLVLNPSFEDYESSEPGLDGASVCVQFPWGRWDVIDCIARLSDLEHQVAVWIRHEIRDKGEFDTFDETVNILYDDRYVLPSPWKAVPSVLAPGPEIERLATLGAMLDGVLDRLGDVPFERYFNDPIWPSVVASAQGSLAAMVLTGRFRECPGDESPGRT